MQAPRWQTPRRPRTPVSPNATAIDDIYLVILGATITIFVLVGGFLLYSSIRFRERPGDPDPPQTHGSTKLELGWTIVPILIVLGIAGYTLYKLPSVDDTPDDAMKVHVLAQQFTWSFEIPGRDEAQVDRRQHAVRAGGQGRSSSRSTPRT